MKNSYKAAICLLLAAGSWACSNDPTDDFVRSEVGFSLIPERYGDEDGRTRAGGSSLTQLVTGVYDASGVLVRNVHTETASDNSRVSIEGLPDGSYKVAFLGVGAVYSGSQPVISAPGRLSGAWLEGFDAGTPCTDEYFYAEADVVVSGGAANAGAAITMRRLVGLVEIVPEADNSQFPLGSITKIEVTFDAGSIYSGYSSSGYDGSAGVTDYELNPQWQFYTLPSRGDGTVTGHVTVYGAHFDGTIHSQEYPFEAGISRNKKTVIRLHYDVEGEQYGMLRLYDADRNASNSTQFFQDGQSYASVASRSFYPSNPLTVKFDETANKATISYYAVVEARDVTILAKRKNDKEYFEVAWLESIKPLEERVVTLPKNRIYRTESGGVVQVDNLSRDRLYFKYKTDNEFLQKVNRIDWPIRIQFIKPTADTLVNESEALAMRPVHAREAVVLFTNMGYAISTDWKTKMLASEQTKPFTDNGRTVPLESEVFPKIWKPVTNYDHLVLHIIHHLKKPTLLGVSYVGQGDYFGMQQNVYVTFYTDVSYATPYHEYGHALGYNHNGNLTYNEMQTVSSSVHLQLYKSGQMPYSSNVLQSGRNPNLYKTVDGKLQ